MIDTALKSEGIKATIARLALNQLSHLCRLLRASSETYRGMQCYNGLLTWFEFC